MAICSKCGREISETALYCSKCGTKNLTRISFRTAAPRKQKKSRKGVKVIAVLLIIAFVITAFFKPGFLWWDGDGDGDGGKKGVSAGNGNGGQSGTADGDTIYIKDLTADTGMTYSDLSLKYTEEQLQTAPLSLNLFQPNRKNTNVVMWRLFLMSGSWRMVLTS